MNTKETKKKIIQAGQKAIEELIKVAKEKIVDSDDDVSADRLKNAAATKKLAIMDAFEILTRITEEEEMLNGKAKEDKKPERVFKKLDKKDKDWRQKKIKARFICALTIYDRNKEIINSVGKVEGFISPIIKGKNGFGYDPIFIQSGKKITFGQMRVLQKYKIDHRFKAFKKIKKLF